MLLNLSDDDFDEMELVEGALVLNEAIDPDTKVTWAKEELARLVAEAKHTLIAHNDGPSRLDAFLHLFYKQWGFKGDQEAYYDANNAFMDKVLESRKGVPVSLGALLLYFGAELDFPFEAVNFPPQFLIKVVWPEESVHYINPFSGEEVSQHTLQAWLVGHKGPLSQLKPDHLKTADHATIIGRWLALLKNALLREERYTLALRCTDLALVFVPDDPYEIRDRGFIYQQLDCHQVAVSDYQYFIDQCPDDPAAELLKTQVNALSHDHVTVH